MSDRRETAESHARRLAAEAAAADWLIASDRGLSNAERRDFAAWLAADPLHGEAWAAAKLAWARFDRLGELPLGEPGRVKRRSVMFATLGAAAAIVLLAGLLWPTKPEELLRPARVVHMQPRVEVLADGTEVELNADAEIRTEFTASLRRVRLVRGEAHFKVVRDPARPFEVDAGGVSVRALGTAFNVRLAETRVDVLVTEGRVEVVSAAGAGGVPVGMAPGGSAVLEPRQQVVVPLASGDPPAVITLTAADMEQSLAWQGLRLRFEDMPLVDVAAEFNRFSAAGARPRLVVDDSAARVLVVGTFRADNVNVFLRFLERGFGVKVEPRPDGTILLRQGP